MDIDNWVLMLKHAGLHRNNTALQPDSMIQQNTKAAVKTLSIGYVSG